MDDILLDLKPTLRYRTAAEVRAIPNKQWEQWVATDSIPWLAFSASAECQTTLKHLVKATENRIGVKPKASQSSDVERTPPEKVRERIKSRSVVDENGCWIWQGSKNRNGYGKCSPKGYGQLAHRVSYQAFVGPIPAGLTIDHVCRNRACVNPEHLEPVTQWENSMRGDTIPARHAAKTHCKNGHPLSGDNVYVYAGSRFCKTCVRANGARYRARKRAEQAIEQQHIEDQEQAIDMLPEIDA